MERFQAHPETEVNASESGEAWISCASTKLAPEQLWVGPRLVQIVKPREAVQKRGVIQSEIMISTTRLMIIVLALLTLGTAVIAAMCWLKSAAVPPAETREPIASIDDAPAQHVLTAVANANNVRLAMDQSSRLNKRAAIWTGVSALLGAITTITGTLV